MPRRPGETFPKLARLCKRGDYLRVQRQGLRVQSGAFVGLVLVREPGEARLGITTTKRIGGAVTRNRVRRLVREAFRKKIMVLPEGVDVVVIAKTAATTITETDAIFDDLALLGRRVFKLVERLECSNS